MRLQLNEELPVVKRGESESVPTDKVGGRENDRGVERRTGLLLPKAAAEAVSFEGRSESFSRRIGRQLLAWGAG
ncbi:hypothetical protein TNCV_1206991 [Trichonephila clavipes]|nr:hypothetical protein TNCV_1206991 [Trichonephila clavipes]